MQEISRNKLNEAVAILKRLHFKSEDVMVVGSVALDLVGLLPENRKVGDVDFLIKTDDQTWRCMRLLEAINNDGTKADYPGTDECLVFKFGDLKVNIWKVKCFEGSTLRDTKTGVYVAPVRNIINAKKRYSRSKDFNDIAEICKTIL